jgi:Uma2 family endonuclease
MWRINPDRDWVQIGTLIEGNYQFKTFQGSETIVSLILPDLNLTAQQVLTTGLDNRS